MKAVVLALVATFSYALETVVADKKLSNANPFAITLLMGVVAIIVSGARLLFFTPVTEMQWPKQEQYLWLALVLVLAYMADLCHFYALHHNVGAVVLCTSYALLPVLASMMKGEVPSTRLIIAWLFAACALLLAYKEIRE